MDSKGSIARPHAGVGEIGCPRHPVKVEIASSNLVVGARGKMQVQILSAASAAVAQRPERPSPSPLVKWIITPPYEGEILGSNPRRAASTVPSGPSWRGRRTVNPHAAGSNPALGAKGTTVGWQTAFTGHRSLLDSAVWDTPLTLRRSAALFDSECRGHALEAHVAERRPGTTEDDCSIQSWGSISWGIG